MFTEEQLKELGLNEDQTSKLNSFTSEISAQNELSISQLKNEFQTNLDTEFAKGAGKAYQNVSDSILEVTGISKLDKERESDYFKRASKEFISASVEAAKIKSNTPVDKLKDEFKQEYEQKLNILQTQLSDFEKKDIQRKEQEEYSIKEANIKKYMPKFDGDEFLIEPRLNEFVKQIIESGETVTEIQNKLYVGNKSIEDLINGHQLAKFIKTDIGDKGFNINTEKQIKATSLDSIISQSETMHSGDKGKAKSAAKEAAAKMLIEKGYRLHSPEFIKQNGEAVKQIVQHFNK